MGSPTLPGVRRCGGVAGGRPEGLLDLLAPDEIAVQRVVGVHADASVQMLRGVQDARSASPAWNFAIATSAESPRRWRSGRLC